MGVDRRGRSTHDKAIFPFIANDIAFINSVVFGTNAKSVNPKNFSSIPDPANTTSTTSTNISAVLHVSLSSKGEWWRMT